MAEQRNQRPSSKTDGAKPPRPFSTGRADQTVVPKDKSSTSNIRRLLKTNGVDDDPLKNETNQATAQTELMMGQSPHSAFAEEDGNQYILTKFSNRDVIEQERHHLRSLSNKSQNVGKQNEDNSLSQRNQQNPHFTLASDDGHYCAEPEGLKKLDHNRRASEATMPVNYKNCLVSPTTTQNFLTSGGIEKDTTVLRQGINSGVWNKTSEPGISATETVPEGVLSATSFPNPDQAGLHTGISPRGALGDDTSIFTQATRVVNGGRANDQQTSTSPFIRHIQYEKQRSDNAHRSLTAESEGQRTVVVPPVTLGEGIPPVSKMLSNDYTWQQQQSGLPCSGLEADAEIVDQRALSGTDPTIEAEQSQLAREATLESQQPTEAPHATRNSNNEMKDQVRSAEFAMSSFSVLNNMNQEIGAPKQVGGSSIRTPAAAAVQKQHILSGQLSLKHSNSVRSEDKEPAAKSQLHDNAPEDALQMPDAAKKSQSKTVMDNQQNVVTAADLDLASQPNRPLEMHTDALDIKQDRFQAPNPEVLADQQVVYNRLPQDYFLQAAEEQVDIDIAINDIKKLRQGFITYVGVANEDGQADDEESVGQIDDFLDPQKFIERHFGAENPDIIFQEVITSVPDAQPKLPPESEKPIIEDLSHVHDNLEDDQPCSEGEKFTLAPQFQAQKRGFTEQNVTPALLQDLWQDCNDTINEEDHDSKKPSKGNLITGETFLKDARIIDTSVGQMSAIAQTVHSLKRPFNDNEMSVQPATANAFQKSSQGARSTSKDGAKGAGTKAGKPQQCITMAVESHVSDMAIAGSDGRVDSSIMPSQRINERLKDVQYPDTSQQVAHIQSEATSKLQTMERGEGDYYDVSSAKEVDVTKRVVRRRSSPRDSRRPPYKNLRMADYFKPSQHQQPSSLLNMSKASTAEDRELSQQNMSSLEDFDTIAAEKKWREDMDARLERDILDNVDVNFIFNKGVGLTQGLLDPDRIYSVMNKLKELAYRQLQSGSDQINYADIVQYLQNSEGFFADEVISKEQRTKVYDGEVIDRSKANDDEHQSSKENIADEPAVVGLGDDEDEKHRRWTQCVAFLRNNPRLLLQMIPNPDEEEDDMKSAITVGRPRPAKKTAKSTRALVVKNFKAPSQEAMQSLQNTSSCADVPAAKKFLAASTNNPKGPACGQKSHSVFSFSRRTALAQRPIKVRANPLKNRNYWTRKATEPFDSKMELSSVANINYTDMVVTPDMEGLSSQMEDDYTKLQQTSPDILIRHSTTPTVNIQTINNMNQVEIKQPIMSLSTPGTMAPNQLEALQLTSNACSNDKITFDDQREREEIQNSRQKSAVMRKTHKASIFNNKPRPVLSMTNSKAMINSYSTELHSNALVSRINQMRIQSGKIIGSRGRSNQQNKAQQKQNKANEDSSALVFKELNESITQFPSRTKRVVNYTSRPDTAGEQLVQQQHGKKNWHQPHPSAGLAAMYNRTGFNFKDRNTKIATVSESQSRPFRSNKNMMKRACSQETHLSYNFKSQLRPSTAATGPPGALTNGAWRKPLASNLILQYNAQARSFNRHFLYNKQTYQTSGALQNVTAIVDTNNIYNRVKSGSLNPISDRMPDQEALEQGYKRRSPLAGSVQFACDANTNTGLDTSACVPPILRSNDQKLRDSGNEGTLNHIYSDQGASQMTNQVISLPKISMADAASQTSGIDHIKSTRHDADVQTEIRDVNMEISPIPKYHDRSMQSHFGHALKSHVDWAFSPLCIAVLKKDTDWNKDHKKVVFMEKEIDIVLQMIKQNFQMYMQLDKLQPFHEKAKQTLKELLREQGLDMLFQRYEQQYREVTVENTLKILLRCQLVFSSRVLFIEIFEKIVVYEMTSADAKHEIENKETYKLPLHDLNEMRLKCGRMYEAGEKVLFEIKKLRADRKGQYGQPFIFKKRDLTLRIKNEIAEMRQLLKVYRQKRSKDSDNSDKPARFIVVTDDEVSEREEVRDSNYIGTDLYWENRFYQVRPFKSNKNESDDLMCGPDDKMAAEVTLDRCNLSDEE